MNLQNKSKPTRFERKLKSDLLQKPYNSKMNCEVSISLTEQAYIMYYYLALHFVNKSNFIYEQNIGAICLQDFHFMNKDTLTYL